MASFRIFYACHAVEINNYTVDGAQSVSMNTNFNLENIFQLGRLAVYDNVSVDPEVELTVSKALDGRTPIFNLAAISIDGLGTANLATHAANNRAKVCLFVGPDNSPDAIQENKFICMSGMYINSINYTFPVDGNFTEEVTFVGSQRTAGTTNGAAPEAMGDPEVNPNTRVLRRQNFLLHATSTLPTHVRGRNLSNCSISANFNREKMFRLGQVAPFHRFVNFPVEITVTFDVIPSSDDAQIIDGIPNFDEVTTECVGVSNSPEPILIKLCKADAAVGANPHVYEFNLGNKASLQTVGYSGGDTGGGNVTITYTYQVFNDFSLIFTPGIAAGLPV